MSLQAVEPAPVRRKRSERAASGGRPECFGPAARPAPGVLDLEDAAAPADGQQARDHRVTACNAVDRGPPAVSVRVNGSDPARRYRDRIDPASLRRADRVAGS